MKARPIANGCVVCLCAFSRHIASHKPGVYTLFFSKIRVRTVHPVQVALDYSTTMCRVAFSNPSVYCYISSAHQDQRLESSVPLFDLVLGCLLYITEACNNVHAKLALLMRNLHCSHSDSVPPTAGTKANDEVPGFVLFRI